MAKQRAWIGMVRRAWCGTVWWNTWWSWWWKRKAGTDNHDGETKGLDWQVSEGRAWHGLVEPMAVAKERTAAVTCDLYRVHLYSFTRMYLYRKPGPYPNKLHCNPSKSSHVAQQFNPNGYVEEGDDPFGHGGSLD